mmetsp:Transcript_1411/g.1871  ORF Transcript_1411/g.1871 Transcript_1411/m.1871 type:complete len:297 (+) Transcript_1411:74-964(+)
MGCPNKTNPYHQCNEYCAEQYGEKVNHKERKSGILSGLFSSKKAESKEHQDTLSSPISSFQVLECPNVSNPFHQCSDYCVQRWRHRTVSVNSPPQKAQSPIPNNTVEGCPNRTNPFHECSDYCRNLIQSQNRRQSTSTNQQSQPNSVDNSSAIQELLLVIEDLQKSNKTLASDKETLKKELDNQRKEVQQLKQDAKEKENQTNNNNINLEGLSASELKRMIKEQKDYLTKLKKKLEEVEELQDDLSKCIVCLTNNKEMIMVPCGHKVLCQQCSKQSQWKECPVCKTNVTTVLKVFE